MLAPASEWSCPIAKRQFSLPGVSNFSMSFRVHWLIFIRIRGFIPSCRHCLIRLVLISYYINCFRLSLLLQKNFKSCIPFDKNRLHDFYLLQDFDQEFADLWCFYLLSFSIFYSVASNLTCQLCLLLTWFESLIRNSRHVLDGSITPDPLCHYRVNCSTLGSPETDVMWEIWAKEMLPKALKRCPKSKKSPNLVTVVASLVL